mmetsp:Transcript_10606/g.16189  ORF Transcript_10606/g.16189 Transcript_10606/m.16189 type:complete len:325 (+) Transcript_10606:16-990(+)
MSYREVRNFCEQMRALGYYRNISLENFKEPNFELVADILFWFAQRYDPKMDISDDIEDQKDRVQFIRQICQMFSSKARIVLNPKKLYEASNDAVKELLKIATVMYKAMQSNDGIIEDDDVSQGMMDFNTTSKLHNLKSAKVLATEITESGAKLFDLLGSEIELKKQRDHSLEFLDSISRNLDSNTEQVYIEKAIRGILDNQTKKQSDMEETIKSLKQDEGELVNKLTRRKQELDRLNKRLQGISSVKPEYQEEYERLEAEFEKYYSGYVEKFTNIEFLEHELDLYNIKEKNRKEVQDRILVGIKKGHEEEENRYFKDEDEDDVF